MIVSFRSRYFGHAFHMRTMEGREHHTCKQPSALVTLRRSSRCPGWRCPPWLGIQSFRVKGGVAPAQRPRVKGSDQTERTASKANVPVCGRSGCLGMLIQLVDEITKADRRIKITSAGLGFWCRLRRSHCPLGTWSIFDVELP